MIGYVVFSYLLGNIMFGYLVSKMFSHQDIRLHGSGNVGARNAGRLLGKKAFVLTFLGDALKGATVVWLARYLGFSSMVQLIGLAVAIIGHLKPVMLRFQGGKGISTFCGGMLAFEPLLALVVIPAILVLYPFVKSFTLTGLGAFLLIPILLFVWRGDYLIGAIAVGIVLLIYWANAKNIKERVKK